MKTELTITTKNDVSHYKLTHKLGKLLMVLIIFALLYFDGSLTILNACAILVWVFGANTLAYLIETYKRWNHEHDII